MRDDVRRLWQVLRAVRGADVLVLDSSSPGDVLGLALAALLPERPNQTVLLMGCMWEPDTGSRGALQRLVVRLADRRIHRYAVQSRQELELFPDNWAIHPDKVRFVPYFWTLTEEELPASPPVAPPYVFAGGDSHREYGPLLAAARALPGQRFVLATSSLASRRELPPNVTAGPVPHREFLALLAGAAVVVVPLRAGLRRAAGQQTYLNAMYLGKPTIVSDAIGVRDYVRHGEDAIVVDGSASSYVSALSFVLDPANREAVARICAAAREVRERFSFERHADRLLDVLDEATRSSC